MKIKIGVLSLLLLLVGCAEIPDKGIVVEKHEYPQTTVWRDLNMSESHGQSYRYAVARVAVTFPATQSIVIQSKRGAKRVNLYVSRATYDATPLSGEYRFTAADDLIRSVRRATDEEARDTPDSFPGE
jgi:hypothetical protein